MRRAESTLVRSTTSLNWRVERQQTRVSDVSSSPSHGTHLGLSDPLKQALDKESVMVLGMRMVSGALAGGMLTIPHLDHRRSLLHVSHLVVRVLKHLLNKRSGLGCKARVLERRNERRRRRRSPSRLVERSASARGSRASASLLTTGRTFSSSSHPTRGAS